MKSKTRQTLHKVEEPNKEPPGNGKVKSTAEQVSGKVQGREDKHNELAVNVRHEFSLIVSVIWGVVAGV